MLVNGAEGEPMSPKDRVLMALAPHLVLDGAVAAAGAVGAREVVVAIREDAAAARAAMRRAADERPRRPRITVVDVPVAYLAGQETALIRFVDGGAAEADHDPAAALRAGAAAAPDAGAEPGDARPCRADRPPRPRLVPASSEPRSTRAPRS